MTDVSEQKPSTFWTLQQFAIVAGRPWYALQEQNDGGVLAQFTGYRHQMESLAAQLGIVPEELEPTTEEEFYSRLRN